jgi:hypothetical protein
MALLILKTVDLLLFNAFPFLYSIAAAMNVNTLFLKAILNHSK